MCRWSNLPSTQLEHWRVHLEHFSRHEDERVCLPCPIGSYSRTSGALKCEPCPRRTFSSEKGLETCKPCPLGSDASPDASSCVECSWHVQVRRFLARLDRCRVRWCSALASALQENTEAVRGRPSCAAARRECGVDDSRASSWSHLRWCAVRADADAMFGSIHDTDSQQ
ncbi:Tyrosine-protein kinase ephrin type A/B receptor-like [Phytophthora cactorum]|nr:Tyrosine-protein kinase ephrin type A/B receptor-like [Phytophthora cactorum]